MASSTHDVGEDARVRGRDTAARTTALSEWAVTSSIRDITEALVALDGRLLAGGWDEAVEPITAVGAR